MARCPKCKGAGGTALFTSVKKCAACGGTGRVADDPPAVQTALPEPPEGDDGMVTGKLTVNGTVTTSVTGGAATDTTLTFTGSGNNLVFADATDATLTIGTSSSAGVFTLQGSGATTSFVAGSEHPCQAHPDLPRGSMYMRDDGEGGSLWVKVSDKPDGWSPLATAGDGPTRAPPPETPLLRWMTATLEEEAEEDAKDPNADRGMPGWQCGPYIPVVAPLFPATVADLMSLVEQEGHEVHAFVTSARDFADVRKWDDSDKIRWEGQRVWLWGVEILRSADMPRGYFAAVSRDWKAALACITR